MSSHPPLPAYEARSLPATTLSGSSPLTNDLCSPQPVPPSAASLVAAGNPGINTASFYGGGGVRIPLNATEKAREDLRSLSHLASFGVQVWVRGFDESAPFFLWNVLLL